MPINLDDIPDDEPEARRGGGGGNSDTADRLFHDHPEGGGAYGGRDNALAAFVGYCRAKRLDFTAGMMFAQDWNKRYCRPPLDFEAVDEKVRRAWATWTDDGREDATPEEFAPKKKAEKDAWELLTTDELLDLESSGGGTKWLVPDVLVQGGLHFLTAPPGVVKSWLLLELSRCVASGEQWFQKFDVVQGAVVYVDEEMGAPDVSSRVKKLNFERGLPVTYLGKQQFRIYNADDRKRLVEICKEKKAVLVCLDTMASIWPGLKENDASEVTMLRAYFKDITATGATVIVAHHDRKGGAGDDGTRQNRMAGSRDFIAMADFTYGVDKKNGYYHVEYGKNRHLPDERALCLDFDVVDTAEGHVVIKALTAEEVSDAASGKKEQEIISLLRSDGPMNTTEIIERIPGSPNTTSAILNRLEEKGVVHSVKMGRSKVYEWNPI